MERFGNIRRPLVLLIFSRSEAKCPQDLGNPPIIFFFVEKGKMSDRTKGGNPLLINLHDD
jgi:hypothetical protein